MMKRVNQLGKKNSYAKMRLGVNIDHIATLRNARGGFHPDPLRAAQILANTGANSITVHLREDRRHISDQDLRRLIEHSKLPVNLEIAATDEMLAIATSRLPHSVCLVPEKRSELTTEGGLNVAGQVPSLKSFISNVSGAGIKVATFIDPDKEQIQASREAGAAVVELHVGKYCNLFESGVDSEKELLRIVEGSVEAVAAGLTCHAGHGLTYDSVKNIARIGEITELNIGHFLVGESIFFGLKETVSKMRKIVDLARSAEIIN